ncbi:hypothetical protein KC323_g332 [Hortaea werneckii]|nr:hypothetical protein KC323_g332 [Hortaea werneckii]
MPVTLCNLCPGSTTQFITFSLPPHQVTAPSISPVPPTLIHILSTGKPQYSPPFLSSDLPIEPPPTHAHSSSTTPETLPNPGPASAGSPTRLSTAVARR